MSRLFVAIPLEKAFKKALDTYRDSLGRATPWARWIPTQNLHVTVVFAGDVSDEKISNLKTALEDVADTCTSFTLSFKGAQYAPSLVRPRMIWGVFEDSHSYKELVGNTQNAIKKAGIRIEDSHKEKVPHITLARFKRRVPHKELIRLSRTGMEGEAMEVNSIVLMESRLHHSGAEYKTLAEFPLFET